MDVDMYLPHLSFPREGVAFTDEFKLRFPKQLGPLQESVYKFGPRSASCGRLI
jgi:hypothetical protein